MLIHLLNIDIKTKFSEFVSYFWSIRCGVCKSCFRLLVGSFAVLLGRPFVLFPSFLPIVASSSLFSWFCSPLYDHFFYLPLRFLLSFLFTSPKYNHFDFHISFLLQREKNRNVFLSQLKWDPYSTYQFPPMWTQANLINIV